MFGIVVCGLLLGWVVGCGPMFYPPAPPMPDVRAIRAGATSQPMFAIRDAMPGTAVPPLRPTQDPLWSPGARYPLAWDCNNAYLDSSWPAAGTDNIDWSDYDNCFSTAAAYTVTLGSGAIISQPVTIDIPPHFLSSGTHGGYYSDPHIPAWLAADCLTTFTTATGDTYNAIKYNNATCLNYLKNLVTAAGARYATNPQLIAVRVYVGHEGEAQPNKLRAGSADSPTVLLQAAETVSSCEAFTFWVRALAEHTKTMFPNQPVVLMAATDPCSTYSGDRFRQETFGAWAAAGTVIGPSLHSVTGDREDAAEKSTNTNAGWKKLTTGLSSYALNLPMWYEFGENAALDQAYAHEHGDDLWSYGYWAALSGAAARGDIVANNYTWIPYRSREFWDIADYWVSSNARLWIVFRDSEYPSYNYSAYYGAAGYPGDYAKNGWVLTPTAQPQVCSQSVGPNQINWQATTVARATVAYVGTTPNPPVPCGYGVALPTPRATLEATPGVGPTSDENMLQRVANRQARYLLNDNTLAIAVDPAWSYYGAIGATITVTVAYLDIGTDTFYLNTATDLQTVTKSNTGLWQRAALTFYNATVDNSLGCRHLNYPDEPAIPCFVGIINDSAGPEYLHEVYVDIGAVYGPTPTPSLTPTPSATGTRPSITTTPVATPTPTYFWDSNEGTPPGRRTFDQPIPTGTPASGYYWPTVVANTTQMTDGAQAYFVGPVQCYGTGCPRTGGLRHDLSSAQIKGVYETNIYVHNWHDFFTLYPGFEAVRAYGNYDPISPNGCASNELQWSLSLNPGNYGDGKAYLWLAGAEFFGFTHVNVTVELGNVSLDTWYRFQLAWDFGQTYAATSTFTATWNATQVVTSTVRTTGTFVKPCGVTDVREGIYGGYATGNGTRPQASFDDVWLVEGISQTPTPLATYTPVYWTVTPSVTPTPTTTSTPSITPTPTTTRTPSPSPTIIAPRVEEVFSRQGALCRDFNLRYGCGADDTYVELAAPYAWAVGGWTITIGTCRITLAADTIILDRLVIYADEMSGTELDGSCLEFPTAGTVALYDAWQSLIDTVDYPAVTAGASWIRNLGAGTATPSPGRQ